jgi:anaphase-promoting complex subunit 3
MIEQGQLDTAERELALARQLDPKNAEAEYLGGVICQRWQKNAQAYEFYTRASEKNPSELAYVLARAESLVAMNRSPEALQILQSKLESFENNPLMRHTIGQLYVEQRNYSAAVESLRQASILAPDDVRIREHLAMALFYNRQYREAADLFTRLIKTDPHSKRCELWVALGECQMQTGRAGDARASFDTATGLDPGSTTAWLSLAKAALQLGDVRRAEIVLKKVMAIDSTSSEAHLLLGYVRLRQDNLNEALDEFQKASVLDPNDAVSLCMVGYVHEKTGKPKHAMRCYAKALKMKPGDELATRLMASVDVSE